MKKNLLTCIVLLIGVQTFSFAPAKTPDRNIAYAITGIAHAIALEEFLRLTPKKIEEFTGKKLTFKQKVAFALLKIKLRKNIPAEKIKSANNPGTLSLLLGIVAIIGLLGIGIPVLGFIGLFSAIAAIIFGIKGLRRNKKDTTSLIGLILGGVYFLLAFIFIAFIINFGYK